MKQKSRELIKKEYHHLDTIYFNTAYFGPSPYSAKQKVARSLQKELDPSFHDYNTWMGVAERMRVQLAQILNTSPDNITHATSTSDIINTIALGYNFKPTDRVLVANKEYPSNVLPWMLFHERGRLTLDLKDLEDSPVVTVEWLKKHLTKDTKVFDVSHVSFDSGKKIDLLEIGKFLKERDVLFVVDTTQALGGMGISKEELEVIDVVACSSYKWMLGPYGHAFGYFSEKAQSLIEHTTGNWIKSPNSKVVTDLVNYTTECLPGARKYDRGQASNMLANSCLEAGVELLLEVGLDEINAHNQTIRNFFLENYPKNKFKLITPMDHMGNILALKAQGGADSVNLERELKYRNIDVSVRQGNVRLSFHLFNTTEQVEKLIEALDTYGN